MQAILYYWRLYRRATLYLSAYPKNTITLARARECEFHVTGSTNGMGDFGALGSVSDVRVERCGDALVR